jgi:hypothetical protein
MGRRILGRAAAVFPQLLAFVTTGTANAAVDIPVATLSSLGQTGGGQFCQLFGTTVPCGAKLAGPYSTHRAFVLAWSVAILRTTLGGIILPEDAGKLVATALASNAGFN